MLKLLGKFSFGNVPQWISAICSIGTLIFAWRAFVSPVFQNAVLKEEHAKLQIELKTLDSGIKRGRDTLWNYACVDTLQLFQSGTAFFFVKARQANFADTSDAPMDEIVNTMIEKAGSNLMPNEKTAYGKMVAEYFRDGKSEPMKLFAPRYNAVLHGKLTENEPMWPVSDQLLRVVMNDFMDHCQRKVDEGSS